MAQWSFARFRWGMVAYAAILAAQCSWLLLTQFTQDNLSRLPIDSQSAASAVRQRNDETWAAWIGYIHGDLWADAAYTHADLLWTNSATDETASSASQAVAELDRAVRYAPHLSGGWLLRAALVARYPVLGAVSAAGSLRMSYYTGPSELQLLPLRASVATRLASLDPELEELAARDLRLLLSHGGKASIVRDYQLASAAGKHLIERIAAESDPTLASDLHVAPQ